MKLNDVDVEVHFEGTTYQLTPNNEPARVWLKQQRIPQVVPTIGINKLLRRIEAAGFTVRPRPGSLQERPVDPDIGPLAGALAIADVVRRVLEKQEQEERKKWERKLSVSTDKKKSKDKKGKKKWLPARGAPHSSHKKRGASARGRGKEEGEGGGETSQGMTNSL